MTTPQLIGCFLLAWPAVLWLVYMGKLTRDIYRHCGLSPFLWVLVWLLGAVSFTAGLLIVFPPGDYQ